MSAPRKVLSAQENVSLQTNELVPSVKSRATGRNGPPKAPRSPFICFTDAKKKEIMARLGVSQSSAELLKLVAKEWRELPSTTRAYWDEEARNDKVRFVREKAAYKGPWTVPKRRAKKHPLAPKRPMSAFLKYSQKRRSTVKVDNPDMSNTDVSRLLGEMWRNASPTERAPYVEQEEKERAVYKERIKKWKDEQAKVDAASRTSHKTVQKMAEYQQPPPVRQMYKATARPTTYELSSSTFGAPARHGTVDETANRVDQRMMFRHNFGAPFPSYRPAPHEMTRHPPVYHHTNPPNNPHNNPDYHHSADHMPVIHRSFASHQLEEEEDVPYPGNPTNYFSDSMGFNFYSNNGYP